jgi:steroid 5-alpha reductase family enzyme
MAFLSIFPIIGLSILGMVTALWILSLVLKNSSIIDIFWGSGFVIVAWIAFALTAEEFSARKLLLNTLVSIWGIRLSLHILVRNWGKPEDFRYQTWRKEAGRGWWWRSYFKVFLLQGIIMWLVSTPLVATQAAQFQNGLIWLDFIAVLVWLIGFFFEAVGDWQLTRFKADPANKGKILQTGVWRYTRHPNYFGDSAQWWAYYLFVLSSGGWWAIFSPVLMTFLLVRVSGVALLEKSMKSDKPGYKEYIERTSAFIPWFPRS